MAALWSDIRSALGGAVAQGARRVAQRLDKGNGPQIAGVPGLRPVLHHPVPDKPAKVPEPKAAFSDPLSIMQAFGYKDRPSAVSYQTMREVVYRLPLISTIIQVRVEQVASFGHVANDRYQMGFRVKLRERHDTPSDAEFALCRKFEKFLLQTGMQPNPMRKDSFETYLRKIVRDALVFDQNCTELVPGQDGRPCEFWAIDAANVRLAHNLRNHIRDPLADDISYVEVWDESIRNQWRDKDIIFGVRNPSTDIRLNGYGTSELEYIMSSVTQMLNAINYNSAAFTNGTMARGILNIRDEDLSNAQLNQIEQRWNAMLKGVENAWKTPVIAAKNGVDWVNLQGATDIQYREWLDWLVKCITASYKIAPEELNLTYGNIGQNSTLAESSNKDKITDSKERGLRPLLRHISGNINRYLIWPHCPDLEFEFSGLDAMTREEQADFNNKRVSSYLTLNEIRAEEDLDPLPGGDIVLNGTYLQNKLQAQQVQQQAQQPDFGMSPSDASDESGTPEPSTVLGARELFGFKPQQSPNNPPPNSTEPVGARELLSVGKSQKDLSPPQRRLDVTL